MVLRGFVAARAESVLHRSAVDLPHSPAARIGRDDAPLGAAFAFPLSFKL
jgi:hypothetical protein